DVLAGNGSVSPPTAMTSSSGHAQTTVTIGTAVGLNQIYASADSFGVALQINGTPGTANRLTLNASSASIQVSGAGTSMSARVEDRYGNLVTTATPTVTFTITSGTGTVTAASVTAAGGIATTTIKSDNVGSITVQGSSTGLTPGQVTINVT